MDKIKYNELLLFAESLNELNEVLTIEKSNYYRLIYKDNYAEAPKQGDQDFLDKLYLMNKPVKKQAFASKIVEGGKKLFKRVHGISKNCDSGVNTIDFIVPYTQAKLESVEILWCPKGCTANLNVYDTENGTISGVPNLKINQFGFNVSIRQEYHLQRSQYDADVIQGMKIQLEITAPSSCEIGFNLELNELV